MNDLFSELATVLACFWKITGPSIRFGFFELLAAKHDSNFISA